MSSKSVIYLEKLTQAVRPRLFTAGLAWGQLWGQLAYNPGCSPGVAPKMPLTEIAVRNAKARAKPVRLFDGGGLYLEIAPSGGKWWRFKYRFTEKEKRLSLGVYPEVSLKAARANGSRSFRRTGSIPIPPRSSGGSSAICSPGSAHGPSTRSPRPSC